MMKIRSFKFVPAKDIVPGFEHYSRIYFFYVVHRGIHWHVVVEIVEEPLKDIISLFPLTPIIQC